MINKIKFILILNILIICSISNVSGKGSNSVQNDTIDQNVDPDKIGKITKN